MDMDYGDECDAVFSDALALFDNMPDNQKRDAKHEMDGGFGAGADGYRVCRLFFVYIHGKTDGRAKDHLTLNGFGRLIHRTEQTSLNNFILINVNNHTFIVFYIFQHFFQINRNIVS